MERAILSSLLIVCLSFGVFAQDEEQEVDVLGRHVYMAKNFKKADKVVFSKFIVTYSTAASQAGPLDEEHSRFGTYLQGASKELMQQVTDSLYAMYCEFLTDAGYEILDNTAVTQSKSLASWKLEESTGEPWLADLPYDLQQFGDREVAICFAKGTPNYQHADLTRLPGKNGKFQDLSNETDAIVISAGFHVYFMEYDKNALGNTNVVNGGPKLYLASNMQTRLNTQVTFHYWTEKMKEPIMATYWLEEPLEYNKTFGTYGSQKEAISGGDLSPKGTSSKANNYVEAEKAVYATGSDELLQDFSKMALNDWQSSIKGK